VGLMNYKKIFGVLMNSTSTGTSFSTSRKNTGSLKAIDTFKCSSHDDKRTCNEAVGERLEFHDTLLEFCKGDLATVDKVDAMKYRSMKLNVFRSCQNLEICLF